MTTTDRTRPVPRSGLRRVAPLLFVVAFGARIVWMLAGPNNFNFVDLRVYYEAAQRVTSGGLYDFFLTEYTPAQPLPFTYPPFAALCLYPLSWLPFEVVAVGWVVLTAGLLFLTVRMCLAIVGTRSGNAGRLGDVPASTALLWTAACLWIDPVRTNLDYGQINVVLMTLGVWAAYLINRSSVGRSGPLRLAKRPDGADWLSGAAIGVAAGIKLTPAVGGLFLLARGRPWAAAASAATFGATVALSYAFLPAETRRYFTVLLGDTGPIGNPAKADNQSLRGALSRLLGEDVGSGTIWIVAVAIAAVLLFGAWWIVRRCDALIALVLVQLLGLLASPISWIHHWVWIVPLLIWLLYGPLGRFGGDSDGAIHRPGPGYTRWSTVLVAVLVVLGAVGITSTRSALDALEITGGPLWALLLAPGPIATVGLIALIASHRRSLNIVG